MHHRYAASLIAIGAACSATTALAHEGHGLPGPHWHATDVWGFVGLGLMLVVAIWLSKGGK